MPDERSAPRNRRVVTGHDRNRVAKALIDAPAANAKYPSGEAIVSTLMWVTDATPCDISIGEGIRDEGDRILGTPPPANGTRFAILEIGPSPRGVMHRTETLDYVVILSGRIDMDMDDSTVHLGPGDVVIQRGTNHAWVNRYDEPCRLAVVLVDAKPLGIGHPRPREDGGGYRR